MSAEADLYAVIMAGGSGTRFWPLSRRDRPKQFLDIVGDSSMLQQTWERCVGIVGDSSRVLVVTSAAYAELTREQLPDLRSENLLAEPQARNTAPCLAWSAAELERRTPGALMAVFPADHVIEDTAGLGESIRAGCAAASEGYLVTFGVPPRYPETGYGYIEVGDALPISGHSGASSDPVDSDDSSHPDDSGGSSDSGGWRDSAEVPVKRVRAFREKPDADTARGYVEAGNFLWNSGMFVWRASVLRTALERHLPEAGAAAQEMLQADDAESRQAAYSQMPATSIDYGIMERADNVACVEAQFDWSDVGSWEALQELLPGDEHGNVLRGDVVTLRAHDNLVHAPGQVVALLGVERIAVIRAGEVLLVASLQSSQDIKALRELLVERGLEHTL